MLPPPRPLACPVQVRQGYTVVIGICVAWIFARVPSWTAWVLLGVMALYDLYAVLHKRGPLRHLVEEALASHGLPPGLVYESRAVQSDSQAWTVRHGRRGGADGARLAHDLFAPVRGVPRTRGQYLRWQVERRTGKGYRTEMDALRRLRELLGSPA